MAIDRQSPLPLYYQLKQMLVEKIQAGQWNPGDILPTEKQLQNEHDLSRTTVRQAIRELELEGLVTRYRGKGTFVSEPKLTHSPEPHHSLAQYLIQQGKTPGWEVISKEWGSPTEEIAKRLKVSRDKQVFRLQRLRLSDNEPIGHHVTHVSPVFTEAIDEKSLSKGGSLNYLGNNSSLGNSRAVRTLEAVPANEEESALLSVNLGDPMLLVRRLVVSAEGVPIEDLHAIYRGDRFQYQISSLPPEIALAKGKS